MKHVSTKLPNYAADTSGVCSALYELGGLIVVHDASGCNSTYSTFDEPRWFTKESAIYISGLTEMEAILGNDARLIADTVDCAKRLQPKFIALCGSPMPMLIGTDFAALATIIEQETKIPTIYVKTNGMKPYQYGLSYAWLNLIQRLVDLKKSAKPPKVPHTLNILGTSPLDQTQTLVHGVEQFCAKANFKINVNLGYNFVGDILDIEKLLQSSVNLVIAKSGLPLAQFLEQHFQQPYVVGFPTGQFQTYLQTMLAEAELDNASNISFQKFRAQAKNQDKHCLLIGESVLQSSIACALSLEFNINTTVLCPLKDQETLLLASDLNIEEDEAYLLTLAPNYTDIVADPSYADIFPTAAFHPLGHVAFSGRMHLQYQGANLLDSSLQAFMAEHYSC